MGKLIFVTGGSRSGKSVFAEQLTNTIGGNKAAYVATAEVLDPEMEQRVSAHCSRRPSQWVTFEEPIALWEIIADTGNRFPVTMVDCISMWVTNLMFKEPQAVLSGTEKLIDVIKEIDNTVVLVSGEVGWGLIGDNHLSRQFSDLLGTANQMLAAAADDVYATISGLPVQLKQGGKTTLWKEK